MDNHDLLAKHLATLRLERRQQSGLRHDWIPADVPSAYRVAQSVASELGWPVVGWKIAATNTTMQKALRTDRPIYGRVFAPNMYASPARVVHVEQLSPIPEVEYQVLLGADLPAREQPYSADEVAQAVESVHPGLELAECRFIHDEQFPPLEAILADGAGSGTLVYGDAIEAWQDRDIAGQEVVLYRNGEPCRRGTAREALQHPLAPLTWLANELRQLGGGLEAGQLVSTGTLTGMLRPKRGDTFVADFGAFGTVEATYD